MAARLGREYKLPLADSVMLASASPFLQPRQGLKIPISKGWRESDIFPKKAVRFFSRTQSNSQTQIRRRNAAYAVFIVDLLMITNAIKICVSSQIGRKNHSGQSNEPNFGNGRNANRKSRTCAFALATRQNPMIAAREPDAPTSISPGGMPYSTCASAAAMPPTRYNQTVMNSQNFFGDAGRYPQKKHVEQKMQPSVVYELVQHDAGPPRALRIESPPFKERLVRGAHRF